MCILRWITVEVWSVSSVLTRRTMVPGFRACHLRVITFHHKGVPGPRQGELGVSSHLLLHFSCVYEKNLQRSWWFCLLDIFAIFWISSVLVFFFSATSPVLLLRWVEEILHHLGWLKPYKWWDKPPVNWCRISSIHSRIPFFGWCLAPQCEIYVFHELIFTSPWPLYGEVPDFFRGEIHIAKISSQIVMVETPSYP